MSSNQILLLIIGAWLFTRTITKDSSGKTLVDHLMDLGSSASSSAASATSTAGYSSPQSATSYAQTAAAAATLRNRTGANVTALSGGVLKVAGA